LYLDHKLFRRTIKDGIKGGKITLYQNRETVEFFTPVKALILLPCYHAIEAVEFIADINKHIGRDKALVHGIEYRENCNKSGH